MRRHNHEQAIRLVVRHDQPEEAWRLVVSLGLVGLVPMLAVDADHAERLADADVDGLLRVDDDYAELRLVEPDWPLLSRWLCQGQAEIQTALTVRDLMMRAGRCRTLVWGPLEIQPRLFTASWHGRPLALSPIQLRLLSLLVGAGGEVVTRQQIAARVFGDTFDRTGDRLDAHVRRIRHLLEEDPSHPRFLLTVRGEGLRLGEPDADEAAG
jgi:DNA-binding winged helix-turn-helix (wHTH) protein